MMRLIRPSRYPHWGRYVYSKRGWDRRVVRRLRLDGFTMTEIRKLHELYFNSGLSPHQDQMGTYRNKRRYRLHAMSRQQLHYDRKRPLFDLVIRSGLFYVFYDDNDHITGFVSPTSVYVRGVIFFSE